MRTLESDVIEMFSWQLGHGGTYSDDNIESHNAALLFDPLQEKLMDDVPFGWTTDCTYELRDYFVHKFPKLSHFPSQDLPYVAMNMGAYFGAFNNHEGSYLFPSSLNRIYFSFNSLTHEPEQLVGLFIQGLDFLWVNQMEEICTLPFSS